MTYRELQKLARELGLSYIGVPKAELERTIAEKQSPKNTTPIETSGSSPMVEPVKAEIKPLSGNTAIVYDGNREVRRYTADMHGPKFAQLAEQFIVGRKYTIKIVDMRASHVCSACGHREYV